MMSQAATDPDKYADLSPNDINDLALIYIGSNHRSDWSKEIFRPYVVHNFPDGHSSWMFDGFLMVEFVVYSDDGTLSYAIDGDWPYGDLSRKEHWEYVLKHQLGLDNCTGCKAIDELITELTPKLGAPNRKHKIVFSVPVPTKATRVWGSVGGRDLNFEGYEDRIIAINWYIDRVMEEWKKADFKNLELAGFYWVQESPQYGEATGIMATKVNEYVHSLGLKSYWVPYLAVKSRDKWREMNFDVAYTQPNYAFNTSVPYTQLTDAIDSSYELGLGLEMEFEGYNFTNVKGKKIKTPAAACGLYDISPTFWHRVKDYIDAFENGNVWDTLPIAYYAGYQAFYDYEKSGNPKDKELMDRIASHMERRHITTGWYEPKNAGIDEAVSDSKQTVYGGKGYIYMTDRNAAIYTPDGRQIHSPGQAVDTHHFGYSVACEPGIYIVKTMDNAVKVSVSH